MHEGTADIVVVASVHLLEQAATSRFVERDIRSALWVHYEHFMLTCADSLQWITSNAPTAFVVADQYYTKFNASITPLPFQPVDNTIAKALSIQFASTVSHLETLNPNLLISISRTLQAYRPEYNISDSFALAPVLAVLSNRLLSIAKWNITYSSDHQTESSPIIWQLFGSGPRLKWEWITVIILAVLMIAVTTSLVFSLIHRHVSGEWLRPGSRNCYRKSLSLIDS